MSEPNYGKCQYPGCDKEATIKMKVDETNELKGYCDPHASIKAKEVANH